MLFDFFKQYLTISPQNFQFINVNSLEGSAREFISDAADEFMKNIRSTCGPDCNSIDRNVAVYLKVESSSVSLGWETNEVYDLEVSTVGTFLISNERKKSFSICLHDYYFRNRSSRSNFIPNCLRCSSWPGNFVPTDCHSTRNKWYEPARDTGFGNDPRQTGVSTPWTPRRHCSKLLAC